MQVVMDKTLSAAAKQTYMYLKALGYGAQEVVFAVTEFFDFFGVSRTTLYRHLSLLAKSAVLRFESPGNRTTGLMYVAFLVDPSQSWQDHKRGNSNPKNGTVPKTGTPNPRKGTEKSMGEEAPLLDEVQICARPKSGSPNIGNSLLSTSTTAANKDSNNPEFKVVVEGGAGGMSQSWDESQKWDGPQEKDDVHVGSGTDIEEADAFPFKVNKKLRINSVQSLGDTRSGICIRILTRITGWFAYPGTWDYRKAEDIIWTYYEHSSHQEDAAAKALELFLVEWTDRGYNPTNPAWLTDWAATRYIPAPNTKKGRTKGVDYGDDGLSPVERRLRELKA
jgi:hypothetical protein